MTSPVTTKQVRLAERPVGFPDDTTWSIETHELPALADGEFLVNVDHISLDPAMRGWLNDVRSYVPPVGIGEVMRAIATGVVTESKNPQFPVGSPVRGMFGVTERAISDGKDVEIIDTKIAGPATWLGALGMPGMTAYFGLFDICAPQPGETVVVSAAAGAVGSVVGQLAKAHGCRVIGIAGGKEKCDWLLDIGFDDAIDYRNDNVLKKLREIAPKGVDVYFDNVGGDILDAALANLRRGARIAICGAIASYNDTTLPPGPSRYMSLLVFRAMMKGFVVFDYEDRYAEGVDAIGSMITDGKLIARETIVDGGIEAFGQTLLGLYHGRNTGKLVLAV